MSTRGAAEEYSSESFLEDDPSGDNENVRENLVVDKLPIELEEDGNRESFSSAVENLLEVSSPQSPPVGGDSDDDDDHEDAGVVGTCMSTIEEESKSCYASSTAPSVSHSHRPVVEEEQEHLASSQAVEINKYATEHDQDLNVSTELREFKELVDNTEAGLNEIKIQEEPATNNEQTTLPDNVEEILRKLEQIQNTQDILEQVINTDVTIDADELTALISQIPFVDTPLRNVVVKNGNNNNADLSERSISAEIASIQRLIDGGNGIEMIDTSNSLHSEVAGGNNLLSKSEAEAVEQQVIDSTSSKRDRAVDDVLREYEELEQSLSRASGLDDSFRSDVSSLPPLSTFSNKQEVPVSSVVPVIKPPLLRSIVPPPTSTLPETPIVKPSEKVDPSVMIPAYHRSPYVPQGSAKDSTVFRAKPVSTKSSHSQSKPQSSSHSARPAASAPSSSRENNTQDAYKPRNRRMHSPRVSSASARQHGSTETQQQGNVSGKSYHHHGQVTSTTAASSNTFPYTTEPKHHATERTDYAVAEALKTIQKLSTMVERQETLLEAYSKDNEKLWTQLKDSKTESQEKETNFQDVINSLRTEVATLKLNRLVKSSSSKASSNTQTQGGGAVTQPVYNKAELERFREDAELKSQQIMELRKEVLLLQNKLAAEQSKPHVMKSSMGGLPTLVFQEKEKEYQKEANALKKQVRTLQKILYSKDSTGPPPPSQFQQHTTTAASGNRTAPIMRPLQRTKSDMSKQNVNANANSQQALIKSIRNTGVDKDSVFPKHSSSPIKGVNINTSEIIQASLNCMDEERYEFEKIIDEKNKLIFEKEKTILNLKGKLENLKDQLPEGDVVEPGLVDELRSRIITQNKAIQTLKEHLSTFKKLEAENLLLREDKCLVEQQVQELKRKLDFAQHLVKPENEVLCLLSEKVDELNSRYHHRERQLDTLLSKLTLKTTTGGGYGTGVMSSSSSSSSGGGGGRPITTNLSPRRIPLDQFSNNNGSLGGPLLTIGKARSSSGIISAEILHMADFSPTNNTYHHQLYTSISDLPEM